MGVSEDLRTPPMYWMNRVERVIVAPELTLAAIDGLGVDGKEEKLLRGYLIWEARFRGQVTLVRLLGRREERLSTSQCLGLGLVARLSHLQISDNTQRGIPTNAVGAMDGSVHKDDERMDSSSRRRQFPSPRAHGDFGFCWMSENVEKMEMWWSRVDLLLPQITISRRDRCVIVLQVEYISSICHFSQGSYAEHAPS